MGRRGGKSSFTTDCTDFHSMKYKMWNECVKPDKNLGVPFPEGNDKIMNEVELKVHDMSSTLQPADAYALVLEEVNGHRKLPIIIGALEAQAIKIVMVDYKMPRPMTHDLLLTIMKQLGAVLKKVLIYKVKDGVYYSYLFMEKEGKEFKIDSRTSDAIALALRYKCPICTTAEIMESEQLYEVGDSAFTVNVNMVDVKALKESLTKAVEEENYELASRLRDEIKRREEKGENEETDETGKEGNSGKSHEDIRKKAKGGGKSKGGGKGKNKEEKDPE